MDFKKHAQNRNRTQKFVLQELVLGANCCEGDALMDCSFSAFLHVLHGVASNDVDRYFGLKHAC
jgi:hypothetical protein